jgi:putative aminopeptidase FrvX
MDKAKVPIQFEAYNYSGTDARAFPAQGRTAPVIALLLPTRGNHSPIETADTDDLKHWEKAIKALATHFV